MEKYEQLINDLRADISQWRSDAKKYRWIGWIVAALCIIVFVWVVFFRSPRRDTTELDAEKQRLRDSIALFKDQRDRAIDQAIISAQREQKLIDAYISNQERHNIINKKDDNAIDAAVRLLDLEKLRREFLRTEPAK